MRTAIAYACGSLGGVATALLVWLLGFSNVTEAAGVAIAPDLTPEWIYSRAVWGGLWGGIFLLPLAARWTWLKRAAILSLGPSLAALLVVFPLQANAGILGLNLGLFTPFFVVVFNLAWALVTAAGMNWAMGAAEIKRMA